MFPDVGPDVVDEQVAPSLANVDELAPRLRYAVVPGQTCKLEKKNLSGCKQQNELQIPHLKSNAHGEGVHKAIPGGIEARPALRSEHGRINGVVDD